MIASTSPDKSIDLRGLACPLNYVRCCLAIEELSSSEHLEVFLDIGEPEEMVVSGLKEGGHYVEIIQKNSHWVRLMVACGNR